MSNAVVGSLRVVLGIDTAAFSDGLKKATSGLDSAGKRMQSIGTTLSKRITAPLAAAGAALAAFAASSARAGAEFQRQAQVANAGLGEFQKAAFAAKSVGIEQEKLADILKDTTDKIGDYMATGGGAMADFFDNIAPKIGITAEAFRGLSGPQALQLYVSSLEKAGVSQAEMTFYMEALASDATALLPLLRDNGAEMGRLGERAAELGLVSEKAAASGKAYGAALREVHQAVTGLGNAIAESGMLDTLTGMLSNFADAVSAVGQVIQQVDPAILTFTTVFAGLAAVVGPLLVVLGLAVSAISAISAPVLLVVAGAVALTAALAALWVKLREGSDGFVTFGDYARVAWQAIKTGADEAGKWLGEKLAPQIQGMKDAVAGIGVLWSGAMSVAADAVNGLIGAVVATADVVSIAFQTVPDVVSEYAIGAMNAVIRAIESGINKVIDGINRIRTAANGLPSWARGGMTIDPLDYVDLNEIENTYAGAGAAAGAAMSDAIEASLAKDYLGGIADRFADAAAIEALNRQVREALGVTPDDSVAPSGPGVGQAGGGSSGGKKGGGGGGTPEAEKLREQLAGRLQTLQEGLMTERETIAAWYEESRTTLDAALASELMTRAQYADAMERLEDEHQQRMMSIKEAARQSQLGVAIGAAGEMLSEMGGFNKKALKLSQVFGAAQVMIDAYIGAGHELRKGTFGFASAAAVIAKGLAFVGAIKSATGGGSGGKGGGGKGGGGSQRVPTPTQTAVTTTEQKQAPLDIRLHLPERGTFTKAQLAEILDGINREAGDRGMRLLVVK